MNRNTSGRVIFNNVGCDLAIKHIGVEVLRETGLNLDVTYVGMVCRLLGYGFAGIKEVRAL